MQKRTIKVAILAALAIILVLSFSGVALADQTWSDLPDTVTAKYDVTDNQVAAISDGFVGGLWKPYQAVTRAQFTKMAVAAFKIPMADPATASYTDVAKGSFYYQYIEGAKAAEMINGVGGGLFSPNANITRQQAIAIVSRYIAKVNGYVLATMYTATEIDNLLAHFGDKASISADLKKEVAFAFDMGITEGNAAGNVAPLASLTRIQGAAFLIRATGKIPPANWTAANIELVTADKSENLIGKVKQVTFKVTTADGHPAAGVLVDFDTIFANPLYVGNISQQAAMTNGSGEVTVNLLSTEPGTQRVSAAVAGVAAIYTTAYWVAMDEIYIMDETREAENNAGEEHTWSARVVVFGPGPRSTSQFDWYNVIDSSFDPADLQTDDGWWDDINDYNDELDLAADEMVRTLPGIGVQWDIVNYYTADPDVEDDVTIPSVGKITKLDGVAITPATSALGTTDDEGVSSITIYSEATGWTIAQAIATYPENPYPQMLINRDTADPDDWDADYDWEQQPKEVASAAKLWIPHIIGGDSDAPITPLYAVNNTGEVETFTLNLEDVYGNPIPGYTVEWWIQGVGFFKTDGSTWVGIGEQNKDVDVTDASGQADVSLKSLIPGQTIVHCKVMDKYGLPWKEWNVVKQWYSIDDVTVGQFDADGYFVHDWDATNEVDTGHDWVVGVSGAKYVYTIYDLNQNGLRDDRVLIGDRADMKAAAGVYAAFDGSVGAEKDAGVDPAVGIPFRVTNGDTWYVRFADMTLGANEFWEDRIGTVRISDVSVVDDGIEEVWAGLAGKTVYFFNNVGDGGDPTSNTPLATLVSGDADYDMKNWDGHPYFVGTITSDSSAVTDDMGFAEVSINSLNKGYQFLYAVADYKDNPQDGDPLKPLSWAELRWDVGEKLWTAAGGDSIEVFAQGDVAGDRWVNPVLAYEGDNPNFETIAVQVFDAYGNALEGYKVTWEVVGQGTTTAGEVDTYHPYAHFENASYDDPIGVGDAGVGDLNPFVNSNWNWGDYSNGLGPQNAPDGADDDWAWGYTLNHQIDFTLSLASAAHVDLVLDETRSDLQERVRLGEADHFTNIVNIRVYTPAGALMDEFEVTKVWTLDAQVPTTLYIEQAPVPNDQTYASAAWTTDDLTIYDDMLWMRGYVKDQWGNFMSLTQGDVDPLLKIQVVGTYMGDNLRQVYVLNNELTASWNFLEAPWYWNDWSGFPPTAWTFTGWYDVDDDGFIDAGEPVSNSVKSTFVATP